MAYASRPHMRQVAAAEVVGPIACWPVIPG